MNEMTTKVRADDARLAWAGAVSLEQHHEWVMPWRIPHQDRGLFAQPLVERAAMPAGVRLTFRSTTTHIAGEYAGAAELAPLDVCCDGELVETVPLAGRERFESALLPSGEKVVELWLPQFGEFRLRSLEVDEGATLRAGDAGQPRWITYGSSITQCRTAASPAQTWPAIVARGRGLHLTCLGYGGQCHLDPLVARMMRDLPADYLSMCVGINIYGAASLSPRTFGPGIVGFVQIVRERHPDTPFAVMSPIYGAHREETPNAVGFTLVAMRQEVAGAVERLRAHGDRHVHYVDGLQVFDAGLAHLLPDNLHPNADGYRRMGQNFLRVVAGEVFR